MRQHGASAKPQAGSMMNCCKIMIAALIGVGFLTSRAGAEPTPEAVEFFEKKIRPMLVEHCYKCHSSDAKKLKGGLLLDSPAHLLKGGDSGKPAVVAGQPEKSKLIEAIGYENVDLQMPPRAKLPDAVIADLTAWVKMGAPWGKDLGPKSGVTSAFDLAKRKKEHWAWQAIQSPKPPTVKNQAWPLSPVDHFILAKLEEKSLSPAPAADPRTLIRRLYFDLVGLPPTPADVDAFLKDLGGDRFETGPNPDRLQTGRHQAAIARLVDRLLDSPQFGERWARHWLDLVRYAESRGHEFDYNLPNAYQYRDYVIRALNRDVPYNQFVTEHIAGDLMPKPRMHPTEKFNESILGTGFWFLGEQVHSPVDICADRADRHDNMLDVMSKTFLGLTVSCARCHDHKFDAISTRDYYSLTGFLESSSYRLACFDSLEHNRGLAEPVAKLRKQSQDAMLKAAAACLEAGAMDTEKYLQAARDLLLKIANRDDIVAARKLDSERLDRWVRHLPAAARDASDPLHLWCKLALDPASTDAKMLRERVTALRSSLKERKAAEQRAWKSAEVVVDYSKSTAADWIQDGFVFGLAPVQAAEMLLSGNPAKPQVTIVERGSARTDPAWQNAKLAVDGDAEPGSVNKQASAGRMLRTPSFRVNQDRVHCLVRGTGSVFACVEGHVMIAGPLHGNLVQPIKAPSGFHWITMNVARYKGNRAHVEFTPAPGADFAVAMVVQGDLPPEPAVHPEFLGAIEVGLQRGVDIDKIFVLPADAHADMIRGALDGMRTGKFRGDAHAARHLAVWMMQHAELFADSSAAFAGRLSEAAAPLLAEQNKLAAQIQLRSRLAPALLDGNGVDENVFLRGSHKTLGEIAPRRLLEALVGSDKTMDSPGSGRLQLAQQMTDPAVTPFVPRVMVNRIWHHLFGQGIVASVDNFGVLGERPTHPELLDHLASQFVEDGWSVKKMIRRMVLSRSYQMSSRPDPMAEKADPRNLLLQHMRIRRLEGEAIRDAILQVAGSLDAKMYGPSVPVNLTQFQEGRGRTASGPLDGNGRRSLYLSVRRNFLSSFLLAFDTPIPFSTVGRRSVSNVPAQALILLNDPFVHQQAGKWAKQTITQEKMPRERITAMYQTAFARLPSQSEMDACTEFLERQGRLGEVSELALWSDLAHVLINAKEFIYVN